MKRKREKVKPMKKLFLISGLLAFSTGASSDIVQKFKNPSFSGVGTGIHYLTIENQEHSRKKAIEDTWSQHVKFRRKRSRELNGKIYQKLRIKNLLTVCKTISRVYVF